MLQSKIKIIQGPNGRKVLLGSDLPGVYFTIREAEVAQMLPDNKYREIGEAMNISRRTVEYYATNMKKKLRCHTKKELIYRLQQSGILAQLKEKVDIQYLLNNEFEAQSANDTSYEDAEVAEQGEAE